MSKAVLKEGRCRVSNRLHSVIFSLVLFVMIFGVFYVPLRTHVDLLLFRAIPWLSIMTVMVVIFIVNSQKDRAINDLVFFDYVLLSFILSLFFVILINFDNTNYFDSLSIVWRYILPVVLYFTFRFDSLERNSFEIILFIFSMSLAALTIFESFLQNIGGIVLYGDVDSYSIERQGTRIFFNSSDKIIRARGSAGYAQITGSLHAVLFLFYLQVISFKRDYFFKDVFQALSLSSYIDKTIMILGLSLSLLAIYLTGSGTALLILCIGSFVVFGSRLNISIPLMLLLSCVLISIIFISVLQKTDFIGYYDIAVVPLINALINYSQFVYNDFSIHALFGIRDKLLLASFPTETSAFNQLVEIGFIPYVVFMLIMGYCVKIMCFFYKHNKDLLYLPLVPIGLYIGTIHYDSVFMYPNNLLFYAAMGMSVNMFYQVKNNL